MFGVFLAGGEGPGRRVGELDEEMVYESRVGDVFALGSSSWRITDITHDQVLVLPAPGRPGRLPFWKGDGLGRPAELGRAHGEFLREIGQVSDPEAPDPADRRRAGHLGRRQPARPTWPSSAPPPAPCPTRRPSSSNGSATSWGTGGSCCTRRSGPPCTRRGRWWSRPGCGSGSASTCRRCTPTTASCFRLPDVEFEGGAPEFGDLVVLDPRPGGATSPPSSAVPRSSPPGSGSARPGRCCCRAGRSAAGSRCGSSGSGPPSCSRWRPRYPTFPIVAEAVREVPARTSSTSPAWST